MSWTTSASTSTTADQFNGGKLTNAEVFDVAATNTGTGTSSSVMLSPANARRAHRRRHRHDVGYVLRHDRDQLPGGHEQHERYD